MNLMAPVVMNLRTDRPASALESSRYTVAMEIPVPAALAVEQAEPAPE